MVVGSCFCLFVCVCVCKCVHACVRVHVCACMCVSECICALVSACVNTHGVVFESLQQLFLNLLIQIGSNQGFVLQHENRI